MMQSLESTLAEISKIDEEIQKMNEDAMDKKAKKKKEKDDSKGAKAGEEVSGASRGRRDTDPQLSEAPFRRKTVTETSDAQIPKK